MNLTSPEIAQLNSFEKLLSYQNTWVVRQFLNRHEKEIALFTGNQKGKTSDTAYSYVLRFCGLHPIPIKNATYWECSSRPVWKKMKDGPERQKLKEEYEDKHGGPDGGTFNKQTKVPKCTCGKNVIRHKRGSKVFRFCSETLPGQSGETGEGASDEVNNTQYPELKKWLPAFLIKKDITFRHKVLKLADPNGGSDIIVEFAGYNQAVQRQAGTQRVSVWYDEEPPFNFRRECKPRLLAEEGDEVITLTPANHISYMYDEIFERASVFIRTKAVVDYIKKSGDACDGEYIYENGELVGQVERTGLTNSIAVIQAASDDNPTLTPESINELFGDYSDAEEIAIRRYGLFKQISGRVFKKFDRNVHVIDSKFFPDGIPSDWRHARGIDYHPQTPWAIGIMSISPTNECFIWGGMNCSPETETTEEIAYRIGLIGADYRFDFNLIDPLSEAHSRVEAGRSITVKQDLDTAFRQLNLDGICQRAIWQTWDTRGEHGRDEIKKRLKNSLRVGKPFNNQVLQHGRREYLPTIWVFDTCVDAIKCLRQWRWAVTSELHSKDKPEQKWSHMNMVWEAIFKLEGFRPRRETQPSTRSRKKYFQASR